MVVSGYSIFRDLKDPTTNKCILDENGECRKKKGLINDVELLNLSPLNREKNSCTKFVKPVFGQSYVLGEDDDGIIVENEGEALGMAGYFSKDAPIVCGGKNGDGDQSRCFEWDSTVNRYEVYFCMIQWGLF